MADKKVSGGAAWKDNLTYAHYENSVITSRTEHANKESAAALLSSELAQSKIIHLAAYSIKLPMVKIDTRMNRVLVHQVVVGVTASGHIVTLEKLPTCILMQSSLQSNTPLNKLIELRDGEKRKRLSTLTCIINDSLPKNKTVEDVLNWIFESNELSEKYDLFNSNCQQFALNMWQRFGSEPFPNPAKFPEPQKSKSSCRCDFRCDFRSLLLSSVLSLFVTVVLTLTLFFAIPQNLDGFQIASRCWFVLLLSTVVSLYLFIVCQYQKSKRQSPSSSVSPSRCATSLYIGISLIFFGISLGFPYLVALHFPPMSTGTMRY